MRERLPCEFFLIRYVPDVVKGEFVNIGVLLRETARRSPGAGAVAAGRTQVRFTRDWARVRCMDADADTGLLEGLESEIAERLVTGVSARDPKGVLEVLEDSLSNAVQMTDPRAVLAEDFSTELDQLMRLYVEPIKVARARTAAGRAATGRSGISAALRTEFERAGVWGLMRKRIPAAAYTAAGDPLRIDCGYRVEAAGVLSGTVKMFQAVSLDGDVEGAKGLAFSASGLRDGVRRVEAAGLELTAVVEPLRTVAEEEGEAWERYRFGVETMEREGLRVVTVADLARAAETARRELGL